jgi:hypothetical protein
MRPSSVFEIVPFALGNVENVVIPAMGSFRPYQDVLAIVGGMSWGICRLIVLVGQKLT